nr:MAG TPA: hypothetical protein [Caudoviricetes sp.]
MQMFVRLVLTQIAIREELTSFEGSSEQGSYSYLSKD